MARRGVKYITPQTSYRFFGPNAGSIDLDGSVITYTGLEPILDLTLADNILFDFLGPPETITLSSLGFGRSLIDSTQSESVNFTNPISTMTILFDAQTDTFTNLGLGSDFAAEIIVNPSVGQRIPEPGTLAVFAAGLAGLGWARRRKSA